MLPKRKLRSPRLRRRPCIVSEQLYLELFIQLILVQAGKKAGAAEKEASKPSTEKEALLSVSSIKLILILGQAGKNSSAAEPEVGKPSAEQEALNSPWYHRDYIYIYIYIYRSTS